MSSFRTASHEAAQVLLIDESLSRSTLWTHFVAEFPEAPGLFPVGVTEVPHEMVCVPAKALSRAAGSGSEDPDSAWVFDSSHAPTKDTDEHDSTEESVEPEDAVEAEEAVADPASSASLSVEEVTGEADADEPEPTQRELNEIVKSGLRGWALQLRRTGFPATEYPRAAEIYIDVIAELLDHPLDEHVANAIRGGAEVMREAVEKADLAGVPAASAAQVMSVTEASAGAGSSSAAETRIVRLETSTPLDYKAGQIIPVMQADRQGVWNDFAPALPPNELGQLEFHIRDELDVQEGDHVTLGTAYGPVPFPEDSTATSNYGEPNRVLIIADGTGLAAAKAMVFELMEREHRPDVELMIGVEHEDEFYDLHTFASLTSSSDAHDWLTITCVAEQVIDPEDPESPAVVEGLRRVWVAIERLASATGTWWGRRLILCGSTARCTLIADALKEAGAPAPLVIAQDAEPEWFASQLA